MSAMIDLSNQDFPTTGRGLALALLRAMGADIRRSDTATSMMHRAFTLLRRRHISMIRIDHRTPARGTRGEVQDWYTALRWIIDQGVEVSFTRPINRRDSSMPASFNRLVSADGKSIVPMGSRTASGNIQEP
jgi:hypothetical protein